MLHGTLCNTIFKLCSPPVLVTDHRCLGRQFCSTSLLCLEFFIGLSVLKLVMVLQALNHRCPVNTVTTWSIAKGLCLHCSCLCLYHVACFATRNEINRIILKFVFTRHIWVLDYSFLGARLWLFNFFCSRLGLYWRVINLRLLFISPVHAIEHLSNLVMPAKVLI